MLTRIGVLAQRNTPVRLAFEPGSVTVSAISDQVGEGHESLPVALLAASRWRSASTSSSCAPASRASSATRCGWGSSARCGPGCCAEPGDDYRYLLMPIRLNA